MARHRKKYAQCPNCATPLKEHDHFCPHCGQENHGLKVPFKHLFLELFESVFHFETKFFTTLKIILTRPGQITVDFWEGRRARYMHPFRMYLLVSVFFFLCANKVADQTANAIEKSIAETESHDARIAELQDLVKTDSLHPKDQILNTGKPGDLSHVDLHLPTDKAARESAVLALKTATNFQLDSVLGSIKIAKTAINRESLKKAFSMVPDETNIPTQIEMGPIYVRFSTLEEREVFLNKLKTFSGPQLDSLLRSLNMKTNTLNRTFLKQVAKMNMGNEHVFQEITHLFMKNLSIVMFILMPLVSFLLYLFFYNRNRFYYEHLVFSIHAHTILFLVTAIALIIYYLIPATGILQATFLLNWGYFFLSLKNVYRLGWLATCLRFLLLSLVYLAVVIGLLFLAFIWGFMTF